MTIHTENDGMTELVYGLVLLPLAVTVKELRYRGLSETQVSDIISMAITKGFTQYAAEVAQSSAGH